MKGVEIFACPRLGHTELPYKKLMCMWGIVFIALRKYMIWFMRVLKNRCVTRVGG